MLTTMKLVLMNQQIVTLPSELRHCWSGIRNSIQTIKLSVKLYWCGNEVQKINNWVQLIPLLSNQSLASLKSKMVCLSGANLVTHAVIENMPVNWMSLPVNC